MQTTVEDEGTFSFYWKVSSESGYDFLEFYIDSTLQTGRISGSTNWAQKSYDITGSGTHTLKWRYVKDGSESSGYDCGWVDAVQWSTAEVPANVISYTYDPAGRRIEKQYDGLTQMKYLYDGGHIIAEYSEGGSLLHKYIYGPGVDQLICMIDVNDSNAVYYYHFDGLGSVIALTNSSGSVVNLYEYSVYGEVSASDPNHPNRFLFTGREFDKDTGLYYYRARYYNPYIGRFLQTDPSGYGADLNLYRYCENNPLTLIDPMGTLAESHAGPPPRAAGSTSLKNPVSASVRVDFTRNDIIWWDENGATVTLIAERTPEGQFTGGLDIDVKMKSRFPWAGSVMKQGWLEDRGAGKRRWHAFVSVSWTAPSKWKVVADAAIEVLPVPPLTGMVVDALIPDLRMGFMVHIWVCEDGSAAYSVSPSMTNSLWSDWDLSINGKKVAEPLDVGDAVHSVSGSRPRVAL